MQLFQYPFVVITLLVFCFLGLMAVGAFFAAKGVKTAKGHADHDFTTINKLENDYKKLGKNRSDRYVFYFGLTSDNHNNLNDKSKVFFDIKQILLHYFSALEDSDIALYDEKNFLALAAWDDSTVLETIHECQAELNQCLAKHGVVNLIEIKVGSYLATGSHVSFDDAISRAKQACMLAKNVKSSYVKWNSQQGKALEKKIKIENTIEKEIDNNRFYLEYQPVLDAKTKKIIGAEVLSRLNSETNGILSPGSFLSAVNSVEINQKFDYYIFEKSCKWISNDKKQRENYTYTINFSRATLSEPASADRIIGIAEKYDLKFSCLAVEIVEDKKLSNEAKEQMVQNLSILKERGISVLLDDFGSGYTTFGDLQNLDISIVKIDKSITQNSVTDTGFIILKNIIQTSKEIGFKTLCEGIETKEQEEAAIRAGCDLLQGFYYYKPMSVSMLERTFSQGQNA